MKDLIKFELSVLIEKNLSTNERKLNTEIEKLLNNNSQLREINLVQFKKSKWCLKMYEKSKNIHSSLIPSKYL